MRLGSGFSKGQKVLLGVIGLELLLLAGQAYWHATSRPAPRVNLARFDPSYAQDIAQFVDSANLETAEDWIALADHLRSLGLFPEAEPPVTDMLRHPVNLLVVRYHPVSEAGYRDKPAADGTVDQGIVASPAVWIVVPVLFPVKQAA